MSSPSQSPIRSPARSPAAPALTSQDPMDQALVYGELARQLDQILDAIQGDTGHDPACRDIVKGMRGRLMDFVTTPLDPVVKAQASVKSHYSSPEDTATSSTESSASTQASPSQRQKKRLPSKSRARARSPAATGDSLLAALQHLDNRVAPKPEPFDPKGHMPLSEFLELFEHYCSKTYKGSSSVWVPVLGDFMQGEAAQAFSAYRSYGDSYDDIKRKLLGWYKDGKYQRKTRIKAKFEKASREPNEPLRFYAPRLCNLFKAAFPKKKPEHSTTLKEKFLTSIPRGYRRQIKAAENFQKLAGKSQLRWSQIVRLVANIEEDQTTEASEEEISVCTYQYPHQHTTETLSPFRRKPVEQIPSRHSLAPDNRSNSHRPARQPPRRAQRTFYSNTISGPDPIMMSRCSHCQLLGHARHNCRRLHGLCLACGADDHHLAACRYRRGATWYPQNTQLHTPPRSPASRHTMSKDQGILTCQPSQPHVRFESAVDSSASPSPAIRSTNDQTQTDLATPHCLNE